MPETLLRGRVHIAGPPEPDGTRCLRCDGLLEGPAWRTGDLVIQRLDDADETVGWGLQENAELGPGETMCSPPA